ncbi:uncharacterized protein LOC126722388 [Quercus robur]|uniref:uncharacterized protein LOC126722388 n=1 Tax=Quercus robur TaxID=38942 RepID=UPI0021639794|nr:uncharacterized protein LOC126722388 [Quercus robur]
MAGDPMRRNQNLYCHYHQDHGHTTEDCRNLWDHLDQLVREGKLKQHLHHSSARVSQASSELCGDASSKLPLSTINVIFAAPGRTGSCPSRPHDDALVVTLRIGGYGMKRVMINQGSAVDIMYPDLYRGLNLKPENLTAYGSPLVSFEGRMVVPKGQVRLPVQTSTDVMEVDFVVVDVFSPYTAIMGRPWLHTLGPSPLLYTKR